MFLYLYCSHIILVAGVPALEVTGSPIADQTLLGKCIILKGQGCQEGYVWPEEL